jgi:hypothetical protein
MVWASEASTHEKLALLKRLMNVFNATELDKAKNIIRHSKRKFIRSNITKVVSQPRKRVSQPLVGDVSGLDQINPEWLQNFEINGKLNIVGFDVEFVSVPSDITQVNKQIYFKDGVKMVNFIDKINTNRKIHYKQVAATVSVHDFYNKKVYSAKIYHEKESYLVNKYTYAINGIKSDDLDKHNETESFETVRTKLNDIFENNLVVVCGGEGEFFSLKMKTGDYNIFELQLFYYRIENNNVIPNKLKSISKYLFPNLAFQNSFHTAEEDAKTTIRIFRFGVLKEILETKLKNKYPSLPHNNIPVVK